MINMPGLITHYIFGKETYNYIYDDRIKCVIDKHKDAYNLGLQGPDIFFYDMTHSIKNHGFNYGRLMHNTNTGGFFTNCLKGIALLSGEKQEIALAYTYGLLCHFALDSYAHPYIFYHACFKIDNKTDKHNSSVSHTFFESLIDSEMLRIKRGLSINNIRRQDLVYVSPQDVNVISNLFTYAFNKTFTQYTTPASVANSIRNTYFVNAMLQGENIFKIKSVGVFEKTFSKASLITGILYSKNHTIPWDVLNRDHNYWCEPWDNSIPRTSSFIDVYEDAAIYASKLINDADSIVNFHLKMDEFIKRIGNRSYITGLDCNKSYTMKHFRSKLKQIIS